MRKSQTLKQIQARIRESSKRCDALRKELGLDPLPSGFEILEPSCVNAAAHVPLPTGYLERRDWTNEKLRTHDQKQCNGCKLWVLWVPIAKPRSKREVAEMMGEEHEDPH